MDGDRSWMYGPRYVNKRLNPVFVKGVETFFDYAFGIPDNVINENYIKCPCVKCGCGRWLDRDNIGKHLLKWGFRPLYETWYMHGEPINVSRGEQSQTVVEESVDVDSPNNMTEMVVDAAGPDFDWAEEPPNPKAQEFYDMLKAADEPLWDGCDKEHTVLACVTELLSIKVDCGITKEGFNRILSAVKKWLPKENRLPSNQYQCKKMVRGLGLGYEKIDACPNDCMLYYGSNISKEKCDVCGHDRFKEGHQSKSAKKYGDDQANWPSFDEIVWHSVTGMNAHDDNYGLGALGKHRSMIRPDGSTSSQTQTSQTVSSSPVHATLTQEQMNTISGQLMASLQTQLDKYFKKMTKMIDKKMSQKTSGSYHNQEGSSSHQASESRTDIEDGVGDEGEDDDSDDSDHQI